MTAAKWIWGLIAAWGFCFAMSFLHSTLFPPSGDGFTQAMAALGAFVLWQIGAMAMAIAALVQRSVRKADLARTPRTLAIAPLILTTLLWLGIAAWLTYDMIREFG